VKKRRSPRAPAGDGRRGRAAAWIAVALAAAAVAVVVARWPRADVASDPAGPPAAASYKSRIPFAEAKPIIDRLASDLPPDLRSRSAAQLESVWAGWVTAEDAGTRARIARGD
jgi:hypothetical protein